MFQSKKKDWAIGKQYIACQVLPYVNLPACFRGLVQTICGKISIIVTLRGGGESLTFTLQKLPSKAHDMMLEGGGEGGKSLMSE